MRAATAKRGRQAGKVYVYDVAAAGRGRVNCTLTQGGGSRWTRIEESGAIKQVSYSYHLKLM